MDNLPSWVGVLMGVVPAVIALSVIKGHEPWRLSTLIVGLILVLLATLMLGLMTDFSPMYDVLQNSEKISSDTAEEAKTSIALWTVMFPAIVGAIGVNLITSWFQSSKPKLS